MSSFSQGSESIQKGISEQDSAKPSTSSSTQKVERPEHGLGHHCYFRDEEGNVLSNCDLLEFKIL